MRLKNVSRWSSGENGARNFKSTTVQKFRYSSESSQVQSEIHLRERENVFKNSFRT